MVLLNKDLFQRDPTTFDIPNLGVAKVGAPQTDEEWAVLRYELQSFVCDGEYGRGLERILSSYLTYIAQPEQPAFWVSGFFGSGKSHFIRVLEYLWRDYQFPDGATARGLANLSGDIKALLTELSTAGRREGGLWSAAGTLGAGAGNSVRLALLGVVLRSAGLPSQYQPARFVLWLKQNGLYDHVEAAVDRRGRDLRTELSAMYVSPAIAGALLEVDPNLADDQAGVRALLRTQYPVNTTDISDDEMLETLDAVLREQSSVSGKLPCTVIVLDELQQYIGQDPQRSLQVQQVVEACSAHFQSKLLLVATGQAALQSTPSLARLTGRFTGRVMLSDKDVESVVREVVLRKTAATISALDTTLQQASGEISRHLAGTRLAPRPEDTQDLVPDYPILPTRRRFWERVLRAVDSAGTSGQLRTQLRIVHETNRSVANATVGTVVAGDAIYGQLETDMLMSGSLLRELSNTIRAQDDGTPTGRLKSRLCGLAFLIGTLPTEGPEPSGVRATADTMADLLVDDLAAGSDTLRQQVPRLLAELVDTGVLMKVGEEYRLQSREFALWDQDYRARVQKILADEPRVASDRATELRTAFSQALGSFTLTQGASQTPRKHALHFSVDPPMADGSAVPVWVRDDWTASESAVRAEAQAAGTDSPIVFVHLPRRDADALRSALARHAAAKETIDGRPAPTTPEGIEAKASMQSQLTVERGSLDGLVKGIVQNARVFQGGGNEIVGDGVSASVKEAVQASLARMFPRFSQADHAGWGTVWNRVRQGAGDALAAVGYTGNVEDHPVCREVLTFVGGAGKKGSEVRKRYLAAPYGWPQDAIDAALLALLSGGHLRASKNSAPVHYSQLGQGDIGVIEFHGEDPPPTASQKVQVRGLGQQLGLIIKGNEEREAVPQLLDRLLQAAQTAGGEPPLPARPDTTLIEDLKAMAGNAQVVEVAKHHQELIDAFKAWGAAAERIEQRLPRWRTLNHLLGYAHGRPSADTVAPQIAAIESSRLLLADPDPVTPLHDALVTDLRAALLDAHGCLDMAIQRELDGLDTTQEWQKLPENQRHQLRTAHGLDAPAPLQVGTDEKLLAVLEHHPLSAWETQIQAVPARAAAARQQAARLLEPKAVTVTVPKATLRTVPEVDQYLGELRELIVEQVKNGPVVI
jgi:hypothetical protein